MLVDSHAWQVRESMPPRLVGSLAGWLAAAEPEPEPEPWTHEFKAAMDGYFKGDEWYLAAPPHPPHAGGGCACGTVCPGVRSRYL